ncbi:hypothetical protein ACVWY3_004595 [Bradyrhizobium sp. USDA 4486]
MRAPTFCSQMSSRLLDHDSGRVLGRTTAGSLKLREGSVGLYFYLTVDPSTPEGQTALGTVGRQDARGTVPRLAGVRTIVRATARQAAVAKLLDDAFERQSDPDLQSELRALRSRLVAALGVTNRLDLRWPSGFSSQSRNSPTVSDETIAKAAESCRSKIRRETSSVRPESVSRPVGTSASAIWAQAALPDRQRRCRRADRPSARTSPWPSDPRGQQSGHLSPL